MRGGGGVSIILPKILSPAPSRLYPSDGRLRYPYNNCADASIPSTRTRAEAAEEKRRLRQKYYDRLLATASLTSTLQFFIYNPIW